VVFPKGRLCQNTDQREEDCLLLRFFEWPSGFKKRSLLALETPAKGEHLSESEL
jgi:hypothetical protein